MGVFVFGSVVAGVLLYINTVSIIKKVRKEENTEFNTLFGCISVAFIIYASFII
ncbi:hypothetical protein [Clostridium sp.]|uniref:hypothetical protein n=1 Tax=Clostridium sp. TaxID=1506 RepID=UPI002FC61EF3